MLAILDFGAAQGNRLEVQDDKLLFASEEQQAKLNALLAKLAEAEARNSAVIEAVTTAAAAYNVNEQEIQTK